MQGDARLREHRARAAQHLDVLSRQAATPFERLRVPDSLSPDDMLSLLVVALTMSGDWTAYTLAGQLVRRRLPYTVDDAALLVELTEQARTDVWTGRLRARAALSALELRTSAGDDVTGLSGRLLDVIVGPHHY